MFYTDEILAMMLTVLLLSLGGFRAMHTAWIVRNTEITSFLVPTQRLRYFWVAFGFSLCTVPYVVLMYKYGWSQILNAIAELRATRSPLAYIMYGGLVSFMATPAITAVTCIRIYRRPCRFARRTRFGMVETIDKRVLGRTNVPVYAMTPTTHGRIFSYNGTINL